MSPTEILDRLRRIDPARPPFDKAAVEAALAAHFAALGFDRPRLRWMADLNAAFDAVDGRSWNREWLIEEADAWFSARVALGFERDPAWEDGTTSMEAPLRRETADAAWRAEDRTLIDQETVRPRPDPAEPTVQLGLPMRRFNSMLRHDGSRILGSSWRPGTRGATLAGRLRGDGGSENRATRFEPWRPPRFEHLSGAGAAEEAVAWIAAAARLDEVPKPVRRMIDLWSPLLAAFEAGLWVYMFLSDEVLLVPRPQVRLRQGRLHWDQGPAVAWPDGTRLWFWNGVEVPGHVVEDPARLTKKDILSEENVEVRRVMLERYGLQKFLVDVAAAAVHSDDFGVLYRVELPGDEPLVMVKVLNSTPEPDGTYKEYFLRVPPDIATARAAVAWTFGLRPNEYRPRQET